MCAHCFDVFVADNNRRAAIEFLNQAFPDEEDVDDIIVETDTMGECPTCRATVTNGQVIVVVHNGTEDDPILIE